MSTKCSVFCTDELHIYRECFDDDPIAPMYVDYHSGGMRATITLSLAALRAVYRETGRTLAHVRKHAELTDLAIATTCRTDVAERCSGKRYAGSVGGMAYGDADDPQQDQISQGVTYWRKVRDRARAALAKWDAECEREEN